MKFYDVVVSYLEGGNLSWKDEKGNLKEVKRIDMKSIKRSDFREEISKFISEINSLYKNKYNENLLSEKDIDNPNFYSGSTRPLMDKNITDEDYTKYKPTVGDVDFQVDENKKENVRSLLKTLPDLKNFKVEHAKDSSTQVITGILSKKFNVLFQVDFEFSEFKDGVPSDWSLFSHASAWDDITNNVKGFLKQYLLRSILRANKTEGYILKTNRKKEKILDGPKEIHVMAYSVDHGFRNKYKIVDHKNNLPVFEEIKSSEGEYSKNLDDFFEVLFNVNGKGKGLTLESFTKVIDNIKKYKKDLSQNIFEELFNLLFDDKAQKMDRTSTMADFKAKIAGIKVYCEKTGVKVNKKQYEQIKKYYDKYFD